MIDNVDNNDDDESHNDGNVDFGSMLASARKFQNYSVDQISEQLKIPARTITALEENDIKALPAPTFTQGYIRAYAKFLEIPAEKVLSIYNRAVPHEQVSDLKPRSTLPDEGSSHSPLMKTVTILLILAGLAAVLYGSFQYYQEKADVVGATFESKQGSFTGSSLDSPSTQRIDIKQNARLTEDDELILEPIERDEDRDISDVFNNETDVVETNILASDLLSETDIGEATTADTLKIIARSGSWLQVSDANNARLLYNTIPRGKVEIVQGEAPFSISLGNAKTTSIVINDLEIDMSEYIRENNTAKFTVSTDEQQVVFH